MVFDGLRQGDKILFQGDSVTDGGRRQEGLGPMGRAYPSLIAAWLTASRPTMNWRFVNRGVSGNRVDALLERWQEDCIDLKPDVVSILIGINDTWRAFDRDMPRSTEEFEDYYRRLLTETRDKAPARIILMEPFNLPVPPDRTLWRPDLDPKIGVTRKLACEFGALLIPLDGLFAQAATRRPAEEWLPDGVHPSPAGHALIAQAWIDGAVSHFCP